MLKNQNYLQRIKKILESPDEIYYANNKVADFENGIGIILWDGTLYKGQMGETHANIFMDDILPIIAGINVDNVEDVLNYMYKTLRIDFNELTDRLQIEPEFTYDEELDELGEDIKEWNYDEKYDYDYIPLYLVIHNDEDFNKRESFKGEDVRYWEDVQLGNKEYNILSSWHPHTSLDTIKQLILDLKISPSEYDKWVFDVEDYSFDFEQEYFIEHNQPFITFSTIFNGLPETKVDPNKKAMQDKFIQHLDFGRFDNLTKKKSASMDRFKMMDKKKNPMSYDKRYRKFNNPNYVKDDSGKLVEQIVDYLKGQKSINEIWTEDNMHDYSEWLTEEKDSIMFTIIKLHEEGNTTKRQPWSYIDFFRLKKILNDYMKFKFIRDEKGLNQIKNVIIKNIIKIHANTIILGHTSEDYTQEFVDINYDELNNEEQSEKKDELENILSESQYLFEEKSGQWRLSDYGLEPLVDLASSLMLEKKPENILLLVDRVLNVTHQRSDIAGWFLPNGSDDYDKLSGINESLQFKIGKLLNQ